MNNLNDVLNINDLNSIPLPIHQRLIRDKVRLAYYNNKHFTHSIFEILYGGKIYKVSSINNETLKEDISYHIHFDVLNLIEHPEIFKNSEFRLTSFQTILSDI